MLSPEETLKRSPGVNPENLKGALWSPSEMIVEARVAIGNIAEYLTDKFGVTFHWNTAISSVEGGKVSSGKQTWESDEVFICSGAEFETLYPEVFRSHAITKCKLQMMRVETQPDNWRIGPALCGSLSMIHYPGFHSVPALENLRNRYQTEYPEYLKWGIHVMAAQNHTGEITIGDSHEYGLVHDPFDKDFISHLILKYLKTFSTFKENKVVQTWHGIYPKMTDGQTELIISAEDGVTIINGLGGNGMTLSFGLCEQVIGSMFD